jgi:LuxR family maltose regulon positive regulatory protein
VLWQAHLLQAQVFQASGMVEAAVEAMAQAERVAARYPIAHVAQAVAAGRARLALVSGALTTPWAEAYAASVPAGLRDFEELTLARVWLAEGRPVLALPRLQGLLEQATAASRLASVTEGHVLQALALHALGQTKPALEALLAALTLAAPEDFSQVFVGAGAEMASLLAEAEHLPEITGAVAGFVDRLLSTLASEAPQCQSPGVLAATHHAGQPGALVEPLSKRELEVLALIAEGLSNPEIAARLYLSVNTLRAHSTNIYQKLDVHSRVQAVMRAQQLGLLPMPQ